MSSHPVEGSTPLFRPRLIECLRHYTIGKFFADLGAGLTVGIVALPLAMAFGIASGVKPEAGIFTAVIAGFIISALGGSRVQIGGPTGAFVVIVYGIIAKYGLQDLLICTMMAGVKPPLMRTAQCSKFSPRLNLGSTDYYAV
jgi:SulP family sulfate permease